MDRRLKPSGDRGISHLADAAFAEIIDSLITEPVEPAGPGITLDLLVETCGVKSLEPGAEFRELLGR
jgi:hypothetical protein